MPSRRVVPWIMLHGARRAFLLLVGTTLQRGAAFPTPIWAGSSAQPEILDADMHKLDEMLQAEKTGSANMESLYTDLQHKFQCAFDSSE